MNHIEIGTKVRNTTEVKWKESKMIQAKYSRYSRKPKNAKPINEASM